MKTKESFWVKLVRKLKRIVQLAANWFLGEPAKKDKSAEPNVVSPMAEEDTFKSLIMPPVTVRIEMPRGAAVPAQSQRPASREAQPEELEVIAYPDVSPRAEMIQEQPVAATPAKKHKLPAKKKATIKRPAKTRKQHK